MRHHESHAMSSNSHATTHHANNWLTRLLSFKLPTEVPSGKQRCSLADGNETFATSSWRSSPTVFVSRPESYFISSSPPRPVQETTVLPPADVMDCRVTTSLGPTTPLIS